MRELALASDRADASAHSDAREAARIRVATAPPENGAPRRILEARVEPIATCPDVEPNDPVLQSVVSGQQQIDTASDAYALGSPVVSGATTVTFRDQQERPVASQPAPVTSTIEAPTTHSVRTLQERRRALRKALPLQDRWKWDLL
ncbi:hypothetical protein [Aureimonas sp. AU12]|uniref:hypothetical protein n=1 Tax=Aureimonas sp. AU12 TaxID=1638161 RepID=UPI0012E3D0C8|nr:hypothetical protein [Aureimonas sp. AU12]